MKGDSLRHLLQEIMGRVEGKVSLALEIDDGFSMSIEPDVLFAAASLIKVPILLVALAKADKKQLDLLKIISVSKNDNVGGSGVISRLSDNVQLRIIDLLTLMIIVSDNTATNLVIDEVGIEEVNEYLKHAGCVGTVLGRKLMDYEARQAGRDNFTTANDMRLLFNRLWEDPSLSASHKEQALAMFAAQQFNHKLPRLIQYKPDTTFYHKTGELSDVQHDAGILWHKGRRATIAVLCGDLKSSAEAQDALAQIGLAIWEYLDGMEQKEPSPLL
ncbi:MAG: serine hydrolase [bacterium]|nr:serine hydrolase [bacterium]